jgi:hypothetical protein
MSSEERKKILQMVEEGKVSASDAAKLMLALDADADPAEAEIEVIQTGTARAVVLRQASEVPRLLSLRRSSRARVGFH